MNSIVAVFLAILSSYLIGSIPTSFIMVKILKGVDIRKVGSGNVGATNVLRTTGRMPGLIVLIIDILKGVIVVTIITNYFYTFTTNLDYSLYRAALGLTVICGHIWSVFLKFSGGKGVATTIGVLSVVAPPILVLSLLVWIMVFILTNYVSVASLALGVSFPIFAALLSQPFHIVILAVILCILNSYKHRSNIRRLLKGEENKVVIFSRLDKTR